MGPAVTPRSESELARNYGLDLGRLIAIAMVVSLHIAAPAFDTFGDGWISADIFMSFTRVCVPLFFMMSGALLLGRDDGAGDWLRRVAKIAIPTIFWASIYLLWMNKYHQHKNITSIWQAYSTLPYFHFWFVYEIAGIYLLLPVLRATIKAKWLPALSYLVLWFIFASVLPTLALSGFEAPKPGFTISPFQGYAGFLLIGYFLSKVKLTASVRLFGLCLYIFISLAVAYFAYAHMAVTGSPAQNPYFSYLAPWTILSAAAAFLVLSSIKAPSEKIARLVRILADGVFGVYFAHMIIVEALQWGMFTGFKFTYNAGGSLWIGVPLFTAAVFAVCLIVLYPVRKIRGMRYIVG